MVLCAAHDLMQEWRRAWPQALARGAAARKGAQAHAGGDHTGAAAHTVGAARSVSAARRRGSKAPAPAPARVPQSPGSPGHRGRPAGGISGRLSAAAAALGSGAGPPARARLSASWGRFLDATGTEAQPTQRGQAATRPLEAAGPLGPQCAFRAACLLRQWSARGGLRRLIDWPNVYGDRRGRGPRTSLQRRVQPAALPTKPHQAASTRRRPAQRRPELRRGCLGGATLQRHAGAGLPVGGGAHWRRSVLKGSQSPVWPYGTGGLSHSATPPCLPCFCLSDSYIQR